MVVVPLALLLVFLLLYLTYHRLSDVVRIFLTMPLAAIGASSPYGCATCRSAYPRGRLRCDVGVSVLGRQVFVSFFRAFWNAERVGAKPSSMPPLHGCDGVDDRLGGEPRLCTDGLQHRSGGGSAATSGDGRHRLGLYFHMLTLFVLPVIYTFMSPRRKTAPLELLAT